MWQGWQPVRQYVTSLVRSGWPASWESALRLGWEPGVIPYLPGDARQNSAGCIDRADTQEGNTEAEQTVEAQRIVKRYVTVYTAVCREV